MRFLFILLVLLSGFTAKSQQENKFATPWFGMLGFHTNTAEYNSGGVTVKAPLTYADCRAVMFLSKGYIEWGLPVATYFLTGLIANGNVPNDNGEVSFLYGKLGGDVIKTEILKIGLGGSIDARGINVDGIVGYGASLESYGTISPMIYAKINLGPFLIAPVFEYNVLSWTNTEKTTRPGFSIGSHVIIPVGKRMGINFNPAFEKGKFKSEQSNMESSNLSFKLGIVRKIGG